MTLFLQKYRLILFSFGLMILPFYTCCAMKAGDEEQTETPKLVSQKRKVDFIDEGATPSPKKRTYVLHDPLASICFTKVFGQKIFMLSFLNSLSTFEVDQSLSDIQYLEEEKAVPGYDFNRPLLSLICTQKNDSRFYLKIYTLRAAKFPFYPQVNSPALWISQWEKTRHTDIASTRTIARDPVPLKILVLFDYCEPALEKEAQFVTHHQIPTPDTDNSGQQWTFVDLYRARQVLHTSESTADISLEVTKWLRFLTSVGEVEVIGEEDDLWVQAYRTIARLLKVEFTENEKAILAKKRRKDERVSEVMKDAGQNGPIALAWITAGYSNEEIHQIVEIDEKILERLRDVETSQ